jgi:flagellar hook-length control protein FliK
MAAMAGGKTPKTLSMRLEPAELGRIDVSMRLLGSGKLVIDIAAESVKTQALLAGQAGRLAQALGLQSVQVESVQVTNQAGGTGQQAQGDPAGQDAQLLMDFADKQRRGDEAGGGRETRTGPGGGQPEAAAAAPEIRTGARYARRMDITA